MNVRPTVFPLEQGTQVVSKPAGATQQSGQYKDMLGFQAAGQNIGLFYQLEQGAAAVEANELGQYEKGTGRQFDNIKRYGNYATPIEAGGSYS